jgi:hypothetical protein
MDRFAILQSHHSESPAPEFGYEAPMTNSAVRLDLPAQRVPKDSFAPFPLNVWALAQNLFLEVARCIHDDADYLHNPRGKAK